MIIAPIKGRSPGAKVAAGAFPSWTGQKSVGAGPSISEEPKKCGTLSELEIIAYFRTFDYSPATQEVIQDVLAKSPTRRPKGKRGNISGTYPSRKMGFAIYFESAVELWLIYSLEHNPDVLAFYPQPPAFDLRYAGPTGKGTRAHHTADFFVITTTGSYWVEAKDEEELKALKDENENRYDSVDGKWTCPPGVAYAKPLGLDYRIHSSADIHAYFVRNIRYLDDYFRSNLVVPQSVVDRISQYLTERGVVTLSELQTDLTGEVTLDHICRLMTLFKICFDWQGAPLVEPGNVLIFADHEAMSAYYAARSADPIERGVIEARPGNKVSWDGSIRTVYNVGTKTITLSGENGRGVDLPLKTFEEYIRDGRIGRAPDSEAPDEHPAIARRLLEASPRALAEATRRAGLVQAYLHGKGRPANIDDRTFRRWVAAYCAAKQAFGNGLVGLIPQTSKRGNRTLRISEELRSATDKHIETAYEIEDAPTAHLCWAMFRAERKEKNLPFPTEETYLRLIQLRDIGNQTFLREGRRAAYKFQKRYLADGRRVPPHGDRPWDRAHIDHTRIDLESPYGDENQYKNRLWLTTMSDAFTRRVLAHVLSFDDPSAKSCRLVTRDCVRRHGRMPQTIIVDHGKEFECEFFETLVSYLEIEKIHRPEGEPRFGSTHERLFGTSNTHFFHNLRGTTKRMKNPRLVTKSHNPKRRAVWTFEALAPFLEEYLYDVHNKLVHPTLGVSPDEAWDEAVAAYGAREFIHTPYDDTFLMLTSPTTEKGTAKVVPGRGVTINYIAYYCTALDQPRVRNTQVPVRFDSFDVGFAWVYVCGKWHECHSEHYSELKGRSMKQIQLATEKIKENRANYTSARKGINADILAAFFRKAKDCQELLVQEARDRAAADSRAPLSPAKSTSPEPTEAQDVSATGSESRSVLPKKISPKTIANAKPLTVKRITVA
jgi:putative transposase